MNTQTVLLEAKPLACAKAIQNSMVVENKLRNTCDSLRRSTSDLNGAQQVGKQSMNLVSFRVNGKRKEQLSYAAITMLFSSYVISMIILSNRQTTSYYMPYNALRLLVAIYSIDASFRRKSYFLLIVRVFQRSTL